HTLFYLYYSAPSDLYTLSLHDALPILFFLTKLVWCGLVSKPRCKYKVFTLYYPNNFLKKFNMLQKHNFRLDTHDRQTGLVCYGFCLHLLTLQTTMAIAPIEYPTQSNHRMKYMQLVDHINALIESDQLHIGDRLPSLKQLERELGMSKETLLKGLSHLLEKGIIESVYRK